MYDPFYKKMRQYITFPDSVTEGQDYYGWYLGDKIVTRYYDFDYHDEVIAGVKGADWMYLKETINLRDLPNEIQLHFARINKK